MPESRPELVMSTLVSK